MSRFGDTAESQDTMELAQFYNQNDAGGNATLIKPLSPENFEGMLLDVDHTVTEIWGLLL
ncbi:hypothetical protein K7432_017165 [Basidiobolus ranarum]|uniref:Uncharacterized protein n=1 Tax=Basidiobolus ranarum TaxID=34480 RepID=A0ABR2VKY4_9FUNG